VRRVVIVSNSQPSISIFRMSMWVWPEKKFMMIEATSKAIQKRDVWELGRTVLSHQRFQGEHGWVFVGLVRTCKSDSAEVRAMGAVGGDLRTEGLDAEVVSPDLAVVGVGQDLSLER
jgi:hypothetical protein